MQLKIPRNNISEMVLYIWKIIGLPSISPEDLQYKLSFELFLYDPDDALDFIKSAINKALLIKTSNDKLIISPSLKEKLDEWQLKRMMEIKETLHSIQNVKKIKSSPKEGSSNFNLLFKSFVDDATLSRTASILTVDIEIIEYERIKGNIRAKVKGSKPQPYTIIINVDDKHIHHDCHDFETRKSKNKQFCKHLAKLFLILKDKDAQNASKLLKTIAGKINEWKFD